MFCLPNFIWELYYFTVFRKPNTFMIADCGVGKYVTFTQKISMAKLSEKYSGQV